MSENDLIKKNIKLMSEFDNYAINHLEAYDPIPYGAHIVMTDPRDLVFSNWSRSLVKRVRGRKIVEIFKQGGLWKVEPALTSHKKQGSRGI